MVSQGRGLYLEGATSGIEASAGVHYPRCRVDHIEAYRIGSVTVRKSLSCSVGFNASASSAEYISRPSSFQVPPVGKAFD